MTLRIGVIGAGIIGADHIRTISAEISGAEVRAIADIDENRAKIIASQVADAKTVPSCESLIESPEADAVIIASNNATHAPYVLASIAAEASQSFLRSRSLQPSPSVRRSLASNRRKPCAWCKWDS